jgi:PhzF family phenazine biosynthesis protein
MKTYIVDSFTDQPFKGNPAGVCLTEHEMDNARMLAIAKELGLSETAFVRKLDADNRFSIRYFSPKMEIPLCGHATLASAKVIFDGSPLDDIHFITMQHLDLWIKKSGDAIVMEFPVYETEPAPAPGALLAALGIEAIVNSAYNRETNILLLEIEDADALKNLTPDFEALSRSHASINGVLVTAPAADGEFDFHSRYFWPWSGTHEDPVTGGTHTFLTKYWSQRLHKTRMKSFQSSARSGSMEVELVGDAKLTIKGQAVIVFEGKLRIQQ